MPTYAFKCKTCGSEFESPVGGDRMESCRNEDCDGIPVRVWQVNVNTSNLRKARR